MARPRIEFTVEDYLTLPDHIQAQLIEGDLVMSPSPEWLHQRVVRELMLRVCRHLGPEGSERVLASPIDVFVDRKNVLQPDVLVLPEGSLPTRPKQRIDVPVWVAEVLSPTTAHYDRGLKLKVYARAGVREAWLVDPERKTIVVHALAAGTSRALALGETAESAVVPGLAVPVEELFAIRGSPPD